ncbi:Leukocyte receptor cluster member 1, partial [Dimargaris verticillata]
MNILPHKSWHVRSAKNRARVAQDEQRAQAQHDDQSQRTTVAEREHRLARLRTQAKHRYAIDPVEPTTTGLDATQPSSPQSSLTEFLSASLIRPNELPPTAAAPTDTPQAWPSKPTAQPRRQRTTAPANLGPSQAAKGVPLYPLPYAAARLPAPHLDTESKHRDDPLTSINRRLDRRKSGALARARPPTRVQAQPPAGSHSPRAQLRQARLDREHQERQRAEQLLAARGRRGNNPRLTKAAEHSQGTR